MSKPSTVDPRWVLCNDRLCEVSEFAHLPSKERPQTTCPLCSQPVVLKLGQVRAHHYAHREEADCTAGHPETALHLNTKFHFYNELLQAETKTLRVKIECDGCDATTTRVWLKDWDEVRVEYQMDPFRPDIALLKNGVVVAALEILVTHAVDERKAAFFEAENIKWVEIRASESLYLGEKAWRSSKPLSIDSIGSEISAWTCVACQRRQKELERREAEQKRLQEEQQQRQEKLRQREQELQRQRDEEWQQQMEERRKQKEYEGRNRKEVHCGKVVDHYFATGQRQRETFYVERVFEDGQEVRTVVKTQGKRVLQSHDGALTEDVLHQFFEVTDEENQRVEAQGTVVDDSAPWRFENRQDISFKTDATHRPFRLKWNREQEIWAE